MAEQVIITITETVSTSITLDGYELRSRSLPEDLASLNDLLATDAGQHAVNKMLQSRPASRTSRKVTDRWIEASRG